MPTTIISDIINAPRHRLAILIVASLSSRLSRYRLAPKKPYLLALSPSRDGSGPLEPLAQFMTNPAGSAIVNAVGPIRQLVTDGAGQRRYLVITAVGDGAAPVQIQED